VHQVADLHDHEVVRPGDAPRDLARVDLDPERDQLGQQRLQVTGQVTDDGDALDVDGSGSGSVPRR
jgi:hypothetical protein